MTLAFIAQHLLADFIIAFVIAATAFLIWWRSSR